MLYYTVGQWKILLAMIPFGLAAGAWFGLMAIARNVMRSGPCLSALCDIAAAFGIWFLVACGCLYTCYGEIRLFALAGAGVGFALERVTLGRLPQIVFQALRKICKLTLGKQEKKGFPAK